MTANTDDYARICQDCDDPRGSIEYFSKWSAAGTCDACGKQASKRLLLTRAEFNQHFRGITRPRLFVATPLHDGRVHQPYTSGLLGAWGSGLVQRWSCANGTSLMRQRDTLVAEFLASDCTHLLWVDSDIGWHASHAEKLLESGRDFVAGCYARKGPGGLVPANLLPNREGELYEATHVATGFLLVSSAAVERMAVGAESYTTAGKQVRSFFLQNLDEGTEDLAFCRRHRECGGRVWLHTGVTLAHYDGNTPYLPDLTELRKPIEAERAAA
jgi:hypothetical protein